MTRRHLPSPKSSLRMFARLDERGIDDSMTFTRGPGSWSTQVAEAVDGDPFVVSGTSENTPRHAYSEALGRRGLAMEPTRTNRLKTSVITEVNTPNLPDGWTSYAGAAGVDYDVIGGGPDGGNIFRMLDTATASRGIYQDTLLFVPGTYAWSAFVRRTVTGGAGAVRLGSDGLGGFINLTLDAALHDWQRQSVVGVVAGAGAIEAYLFQSGDVPGVVSWHGMNAELGAYGTSWIPTAGAIATRAAELCAIDSALIASDGVLELEYVPQFASTAFATSDTIWTWANGWRLDYDGSDDAIHLIVNGNSEIESAALAFSADTKFELQVRWGSWGTQLGVNGVVLRDGTAWGTPTPAAYLGSGAASAQCEAKILGDVRIAR